MPAYFAQTGTTVATALCSLKSPIVVSEYAMKVTASKSHSSDPSSQLEQSDSLLPTTRADHSDEIKRLGRLCHLMDNAYQLPGTNVRLGLDSAIGLIPGIGDAATAGVSVYMVYRARQLGVRKRTVVRMLGNIAIDTLIGTVPLVGDLFDAAWKANTRNLQLLKEELDLQPQQ